MVIFVPFASVSFSFLFLLSSFFLLQTDNSPFGRPRSLGRRSTAHTIERRRRSAFSSLKAYWARGKHWRPPDRATRPGLSGARAPAKPKNPNAGRNRANREGGVIRQDVMSTSTPPSACGTLFVVLAPSAPVCTWQATVRSDDGPRRSITWKPYAKLSCAPKTVCQKQSRGLATPTKTAL